MSTTCQQIYVRARRFSQANAELAPTKPEILARIEAEQQSVYAQLASLTRDRYQVKTSANSTNAASDREVDLAAITPSVLRVLKLQLPNGDEINQVDVLDTDADFSPRYVIRGQKAIEVGSDWGASGVVAVTVIYVQGPTAITSSGAYSQAMSLPDEWADLLVVPLAMYLCQMMGKGRDAEEYKRLEIMRDERQKAFADYVKNFGGVENKRFMLPQTADIGRK